MCLQKVSLTLIKSNIIQQENYINVTIFREHFLKGCPGCKAEHVGIIPISSSLIAHNYSCIVILNILKLILHMYYRYGSFKEAIDIIINNKELYYNDVRHTVTEVVKQDSISLYGKEYVVKLNSIR